MIVTWLSFSADVLAIIRPWCYPRRGFQPLPPTLCTCGESNPVLQLGRLACRQKHFRCRSQFIVYAPTVKTRVSLDSSLPWYIPARIPVEDQGFRRSCYEESQRNNLPSRRGVPSRLPSAGNPSVPTLERLGDVIGAREKLLTPMCVLAWRATGKNPESTQAKTPPLGKSRPSGIRTH